MAKMLAFLVALFVGSAQAHVGSPDFFPFTTKQERSRLLLEPITNCRAQIEAAMCLVDPTPVGASDPLERTCLDGSKAYAHHFESIYDRMPPAFQQMFCSVRRIFVEKEFFATAYAGTIDHKDGGTAGALIGIRRSVLDEPFTLQKWATWKEQLNFGGDPQDFTVREDLPQIEVGAPADLSDFLYFVVAHEFGHIFDSANGLNEMEKKDCDYAKEGCKFAPGTWGSISWATYKEPWPSTDFQYRDGLCFYGCKGNFLGLDKVNAVYAGLEASDFVSFYAASNPWDDFADSLGYYLMHTQLSASYTIDTKQGMRVDSMRKLTSERFRAKFEYMERFLSDPSKIQYP